MEKWRKKMTETRDVLGLMAPESNPKPIKGTFEAPD